MHRLQEGQAVCRIRNPYAPESRGYLQALLLPEGKLPHLLDCITTNGNSFQLVATENNVYQSILRCIQRDERKRKCASSFAFVIQQDDVRHLIDKIWHGHSALSKSENLNELR